MFFAPAAMNFIHLRSPGPHVESEVVIVCRRVSTKELAGDTISVSRCTTLEVFHHIVPTNGVPILIPIQVSSKVGDCSRRGVLMIRKGKVAT